MKAVVRLNWIQKLTVPDLFTGDDTNDADTIWLGKKRIKIADYPLIRRILTEDLEEGKNYIPPLHLRLLYLRQAPLPLYPHGPDRTRNRGRHTTQSSR